MSMDCIVCNSHDLKKAIEVQDYLVSQEIFYLRECKHCGFRFIDNPPSENNAAKYYDTDAYIEHSDSDEGIINTIYHFSRKLMFKYKLHLLNREKQNKRILDIGTGTGYFLNHMRKNGFETFGIEISDKARSFGVDQFGLDIRKPDAIFKPDFPAQFGYITFWHVLEHVYEPEQMLQRAYQLLDSAGIIVVALPNYRCLDAKIYRNFWAAYDVPRHLWHWTKESFTLFARRSGFEVKSTKILPLDPFYNCLISESYRKKKWFYPLIPFVGAASLLNGWIRHSRASSIIYFLEKA